MADFHNVAAVNELLELIFTFCGAYCAVTKLNILNKRWHIVLRESSKANSFYLQIFAREWHLNPASLSPEENWFERSKERLRYEALQFVSLADLGPAFDRRFQSATTQLEFSQLKDDIKRVTHLKLWQWRARELLRSWHRIQYGYKTPPPFVVPEPGSVTNAVPELINWLTAGHVYFITRNATTTKSRREPEASRSKVSCRLIIYGVDGKPNVVDYRHHIAVINREYIGLRLERLRVDINQELCYMMGGISRLPPLFQLFKDLLPTVPVDNESWPILFETLLVLCFAADARSYWDGGCFEDYPWRITTPAYNPRAVENCWMGYASITDRLEHMFRVLKLKGKKQPTAVSAGSQQWVDYKELDGTLLDDFAILRRLDVASLPSPQAFAFDVEPLYPADHPVEATWGDIVLDVDNGDFVGGTFAFQRPDLRLESSSPSTSLVHALAARSSVSFTERFHRVAQVLEAPSTTRDPTQLRVVYQSLQTWKLAIDLDTKVRQLLQVDNAFPWKSTSCVQYAYTILARFTSKQVKVSVVDYEHSWSKPAKHPLEIIHCDLSLLIATDSRQVLCHVSLRLVERRFARNPPAIPVEFRATLDGMQAFACFGSSLGDEGDSSNLQIKANASQEVFDQLFGLFFDEYHQDNRQAQVEVIVELLFALANHSKGDRPRSLMLESPNAHLISAAVRSLSETK